MARKILHRGRPVCLSATCTKDSDRELIKAFKELAAARGLSVQAMLLEACRESLRFTADQCRS